MYVSWRGRVGLEITEDGGGPVANAVNDAFT